MALTGSTMAEKFRDEGRDILFFRDNIYRYTLAGTEVSALLAACRPPWATSRRWLKKLLPGKSGITSTFSGSITSIRVCARGMT